MYLLLKSPRDGCENESPCGEHAAASPSCIRGKPLSSAPSRCAQPCPGRAGGEVAGRTKRMMVALPSQPTHLASFASGKNKGADLLGWAGVTLSRAGEIFIVSPIRPTNFAGVSQRTKASCCNSACDITGHSHNIWGSQSWSWFAKGTFMNLGIWGLFFVPHFVLLWVRLFLRREGVEGHIASACVLHRGGFGL